MTKEGRLQRGKENFENKRFLNNPETLEYMKTLEGNDINYSSMTIKKLKEECKKENLDFEKEATKDDLIVLLENKSDEVK
jgi:hypothetical protein